jgi:uncharacterized membrane protein (DUF4010 family)
VADTDVVPMVAAVGIGLLMGVERERRKDRSGEAGAAGLRTFALVGLLGAVLAGLGDNGLTAVGLAFVGAIGVLHAMRTQATGLTTPVALVLVYALGLLADSDVELAAGLGVGATILLAERTRLHELARNSLTERELLDGLLLAACALIVLPLLPDHGIGPGGAFNPLTVWRLAVAIMIVNAVGYVALRTTGGVGGLTLAGFLGGFVSATATIGAMGARAHREPVLLQPAVAAALSANIATKAFTAIVLAIAAPRVLGATAGALLAGGLTAAVIAVFATRRAGRLADPRTPSPGRAFDLKAPVVLAVTITVVLALAHLLQQALGPSGALVAVAAGGLADAQSGAVSAGALADADQVSVSEAALGVMLALSANTLTKAGLTLAFRDHRAIVTVWCGLAAILAATWLGYVLQTKLL